MPVQALRKEIVRERRGFRFAMRPRGSARTVHVIVDDGALLLGSRKASELQLQAKFESYLAYFKYLAGEKFERGRVTGVGEVSITAEDVLASLD